MSTDLPFVSIVTPVYNGKRWLAECIESVLAQTYRSWEYLIVNNCSTDNTLQIAEQYAKKDTRIRVHNFREFLGVMESHNRALRLISQDSKYCKIVSADDWIYQYCVAQMVEVAEKYSSAGIVGSYAIRDDGVRGLGLDLRRNLFTGQEACRLRLLGADVIGSPTSLLYKSSLIRNETAFFAGFSPQADTDACFRVLQHADYGFVHQVLSFERVHEGAVSAPLMKLNSFLVDRIEFLTKYGPQNLGQDELERRTQDLHSDYYGYLAVGAVNLREKEFWRYHRNRMRDIGLAFDYGALVRATVAKLADLLLNPKRTVEKILLRLAIVRPRKLTDAPHPICRGTVL
jgi:glycosyltransferase involved in cell wall biosynthesis